MNYLLFTTTQCPKCPAFKDYVAENVVFEGEILNEQSPGFMDKARELNITKAPTMFVFENNQEVLRAEEIPQLEEFLQTL